MKDLPLAEHSHDDDDDDDDDGGGVLTFNVVGKRAKRQHILQLIITL